MARTPQEWLPDGGNSPQGGITRTGSSSCRLWEGKINPRARRSATKKEPDQIRSSDRQPGSLIARGRMSEIGLDVPADFGGSGAWTNLRGYLSRKFAELRVFVDG